MRAIRKVGLAHDLIPSLDDLLIILRLKNAFRSLAKRSKGRPPVYWREVMLDDWRYIKRHWGTIKLFKQDIALTKRLNSAKMEDVLHGECTWERIMAISSIYTNQISKVWGSTFDNPQRLCETLNTLLKDSEQRPAQVSFFTKGTDWIFKDYHYQVQGIFSEKQIELLVVREFDREREFFERLMRKYSENGLPPSSHNRERITENVRIEVWRRDGGKCARCGSRERLEYDHIVPVCVFRRSRRVVPKEGAV